MAQPDINSILAALGTSAVWLNANYANIPQAQQNAGATPQHTTPGHAGPPGYPPGQIPVQSPSAPPQNAGYLPHPSNTGSVDLSAIKPVNSGSVSIADAIAKARNIAADRGVVSHDPRQNSATPRDDPRLAGRSYRSRSRSPSRRDSYSGNPYRDERREDPSRGRYRRSPSPDRNFRSGRDSASGNQNSESDVETISVKSSLVGLIIGRNGENMRKIESESGARVQFIQAKDSRVAERMCTISGSLRSRTAAKDMIFGIIKDNGGPNDVTEKGAYMANMPGRAKVNLPAVREDEDTTQIMVPDKTVGLIIGRGGETIKDLQEKSGCHVNILGENKSVNGLRPVNLIGNERSTQIAKDLILEIVDSDTRGGAGAGGVGGGTGSGSNRIAPQRDRGFDTYGGNSSMGEAGQVKKTIDVPSEAVGMIIGKGGETIKDLQKTTGCSINVNQPSRPDITRKIDLAGTPAALRDAEAVIWEKVETVRQRDAQRGGAPYGNNASAGGRDAAPQYEAYSQQQQQQPVQMPSYAQYLPAAMQQTQQVAAQMSAFQMPGMPAQQQAQAPLSSDQNQGDPYAAWAQYYAQQMAHLQQNPGGAPGT